jgi:hypothetical protein
VNFFLRLRARLARRRATRRMQRNTGQLQGSPISRAQARRAQDQALRRIRRPGLGPRPNASALIAEARARGVATAKSGAIDWWMFSSDLVLPYILELRNRREFAMNEVRYRARILERWDEEELHENTREAIRARVDEAEVNAQIAREREHMRAAWGEINRLARREAEREWALRGPGQSDSGAEPGDVELTDVDVADAGLPDAEMPDAGPAEEQGVRWPGPHAPRIRGWWTAAILGGLIGVELPIQEVIFHHFELNDPEGTLLTWVFTIPVSAVMVLLPHLSGWLFRGRTETGSERLMRILSLALLVPWAYLAAMLGYLRARVLLAPPPVVPGLPKYLRNIPSNTRILHITPTTITAMFIALIVGVGGIGFLLGMAREHPIAAAFTGAQRALGQIRRRLQDAASTAKVAEDRVAASAEEPRRGERQLRDRLAAIGAAYSAAEQAYLDALTMSIGDPAISEAVARMVAQIEGQPPASVSGTG